MGDRPNLLAHVLKQAFTLAEHSDRLTEPLNLTPRQRQIHGQGGYNLPDAIMEFARKPPPLCILQLEQAAFLASEQSNHITGKLIHVTDDWKKLRNATLRPDSLTLRRMNK